MLRQVAEVPGIQPVARPQTFTPFTESRLFGVHAPCYGIGKLNAVWPSAEGYGLGS